MSVSFDVKSIESVSSPELGSSFIYVAWNGSHLWVVNREESRMLPTLFMDLRASGI